MRKTALAVVFILFSVCLAYGAEKTYSFHLFPYGGGWFGDEYLGSSWLAGGRLGFSLTQRLTLEGGFEYSQTQFEDIYDDGDVNLSVGYGDLAISLSRNTKWDPYLLLGAGDLMFDAQDRDDPDDQVGAMWGVGLKYYIMNNIGLRAEARNIIIEDTPMNAALIAGLEFRFGGKEHEEVAEAAPPPAPEGDADGDTVLDSKDQCPNTPRGAKVDAVGCPSDSDGDTVLDGLDECPDTPKGATVNRKGCPNDEDGDGVWDGLDQCPKTPKGAKVDAVGCPITVDSDGDTVPDNKDACPGTPRGTPVDVTGCPEAAAMEADSDGDTVPDDKDKCPHTSPGVQVDENGCQIIEERLLLKGINFRTGSSQILPESYKVLENAVEILKANPEMKVEVQGYTDNRGKTASNVRLSNARAKAVYTYLVKKGIAAKRLTYKGYGPNNPIADNKTPEGRAQNRRIEFKVISK